MNTSTSSNPSPIDIQALLAEFDASGQSAGAFARSREIAPWRIYNALQRRGSKTRVRRRRTAPSPALLPVRVVETETASQAAPLELLLPGGHRLLIRVDFDPALLQRLLGTLASC
jgi:hypothetical protein